MFTRRLRKSTSVNVTAICLSKNSCLCIKIVPLSVLILAYEIMFLNLLVIAVKRHREWFDDRGRLLTSQRIDATPNAKQNASVLIKKTASSLFSHFFRCLHQLYIDILRLADCCRLSQIAYLRGSLTTTSDTVIVTNSETLGQSVGQNTTTTISSLYPEFSLIFTFSWKLN